MQLKQGGGYAIQECEAEGLYVRKASEDSKKVGEEVRKQGKKKGIGMATDTFTKGEWNRLCSSLDDAGLVEWGYMARGVDFVWDESMSVANGVLGKFVPPNRIHMPMWGRHALCSKEWLPTVVHELTHYRQFNRYGRICYFFRNCPVWRKWLLEAEAERNEMEAEKELGLCLIFPKEER